VVVGAALHSRLLMRAALIDTRRYVATPEGIELELALAGPVPRALAWSVDLLIRAGVLLGLWVLVQVLGTAGVGVMLLAWFALEWFYPVYFEVMRAGATPGKRAFGLTVLQDDGTPVTWQASIIRNLLRAVDFLPLLYGFGLASMLLSSEFKRLGDIAARTVVAYRRDLQHLGKVPTAAPLAPPFPLSLDEQRALIDFAERQPLMTAERSRELAAIAGPALLGADSTEPEQRLLQYANFLVGRK
jgi:uncharacterized RDD family membrane protein YckC